eukprot:12341366-Prorocentrum_lima.AAC.1
MDFSARVKTDPRREKESGTEVVCTQNNHIEEPESHDQKMMQKAFIRYLTGQRENAIVSLATPPGEL